MHLQIKYLVSPSKGSNLRFPKLIGGKPCGVGCFNGPARTPALPGIIESGGVGCFNGPARTPALPGIIESSGVDCLTHLVPNLRVSGQTLSTLATGFDICERLFNLMITCYRFVTPVSEAVGYPANLPATTLEHAQIRVCYELP